MSSQKYPTAYRSGSSKFTAGEKRQGFQMPLPPEVIAPALQQARQQIARGGPPPALAQLERRTAEIAAERVLLRIPHPLPRALVATYELYRFLEKEVPAPDLMEPGDPIPFDPAAAGWVNSVVGAHSPYPYGETDAGDPDSMWVQLGFATVWAFRDDPATTLGTPTQVSHVPSDDIDGSWVDLAFRTDANMLMQTTTWDNTSPFYLEPQYFPNNGWYRPDTIAAPHTRPDLWTGPTRTIIVPQIWYRQDRLVVGFGNATEVGYDTEVDDGSQPQVGRPWNRPLTAVAVITSGAVQPGYAIPPNTHQNTIPRPRVRERKVIANVLAVSWLGKLFNFTTESLDNMTAVWKALPPEYRTGMKKIKATNVPTWEVATPRGLEWHTAETLPWDTLWWTGRKDKAYNPSGFRWIQKYYPKPQEIARDLWDHWEHVDINDALVNLASERLEDRLYAIGPSNTKSGQEWLRVTGRPVGFETGPAM